MSAQIHPYPPARRVDFVRRQAAYMLTLSPESSERHLCREVEKQRSILTAKGVEPVEVRSVCTDLAGAIRGEVWRRTFAGGNVA